MSSLVNVAEVVDDPAFSQSFTIERFTGSFHNEGAYNRGSPVTLPRFGSIQPANQDNLSVLPEGERDGKFIKVYCTTEIRKGDGETIESDQVIWDGKKHRVAFSRLYKDYGYWFVLAQEI